ncbi:MAG: hypothetical protein IPQ05_09215 [Leptospiraceae bacterium]|nr:hypothetical protein [Leptospiraceae bacterium]
MQIEVQIGHTGQAYTREYVDSSKLKNSLVLFNLKETYTLEELEKAWKQMAVCITPINFIMPNQKSMNS